MFTTNFTPLGGGVVGLYLLATVALGLAPGRYARTVAGYMVGGRASGTALNTASYIGTTLGLVT